MDLMIMLSLVWIHFIADFMMQSDRIALNKSKSNLILLQHVAIYGVFLLPFGLVFALVNTVLHFITDYCTSRATSVLWKNNQRHWFFVVIGLDQAIHMTCLFVSYVMLKGV